MDGNDELKGGNENMDVLSSYVYVFLLAKHCRRDRSLHSFHLRTVLRFVTLQRKRVFFEYGTDNTVSNYFSLVVIKSYPPRPAAS